MALNGQAWAGYANAFAAYLMGDTPDSLTPVAGGDAVPFVHDGRTEKARTTEDGVLIIVWELVAFVTGDCPAVGAQFTWGGETWQVAATDPHRCAGANWPHAVTLTSHARQP